MKIITYNLSLNTTFLSKNNCGLYLFKGIPNPNPQKLFLYCENECYLYEFPKETLPVSLNHLFTFQINVQELDSMEVDGENPENIDNDSQSSEDVPITDC